MRELLRSAGFLALSALLTLGGLFLALVAFPPAPEKAPGAKEQAKLLVMTKIAVEKPKPKPLPKPKPPEPKKPEPKPKPKPKPKPPEPEKPKPKKPTPKPAPAPEPPPPPEKAAPAEPEAPPPPPVASGPTPEEIADKLALYKRELAVRIEKEKRYPRKAVRFRKEGEVGLSFTLDKRGRLLGRKVTAPSGFAPLDEAALAAVAAAAPFPPPPKEMAAPYTFVFTMEFTLR